MVAFLMATPAEPRASDGEKLPESSGGSVWRSKSVMSRVKCTLKVARKGPQSQNSTLDILSGFFPVPLVGEGDLRPRHAELHVCSLPGFTDRRGGRRSWA